MTIEELCKRSYDVAVAKGWHEQKRSFDEVIALFHSEVSEALECYRDPEHELGDIWFSEEGKPEGITIELADLLIRIGDTAVDMGIPVVSHVRWNKAIKGPLTIPQQEEARLVSIPCILAGIHGVLSDAFRGRDVAKSLGLAIEYAGYLCCGRGWDLEKAVIMKMEYNETRAYCHGGKRA